MTRWIVLLSLAVAACGEERPVLDVIVDAPPTGSVAHPYDGVDELRLWIARDGDSAQLAATVVGLGEPLELTEVPFGDNLVVHLSGRVSGVEIAYGRSCPFSVNGDDELVEPHLYFSRVVRWGTAPSPEVADRLGGQSYRLPDGSAVFVGGGAGVTEVERFDPGSGGFATLPVSTADRQRAVLTGLGNGSSIVVGGVDASGDAVAVVEHLDPLAGEGRQLSQQSGPTIRGHAAVTLVDGSVVVAGGSAQDMPGGSFTVSGIARVYRVGAGRVLEPARVLAAGLQRPRRDHSMTRLGDEVGADVLIVGGVDVVGTPVAEVELYRPLRESFELVAGGAVLAKPRWGHQAVRLPGGSILIVGGFEPSTMGGDPVPVREMELYDPVQGQISAAGVLPTNAGITEQTVTTLPDGRVMLVGGKDMAGQPVATVLIARLDSITGQVDLAVTDPLATPRAGHQTVSLCDGTILVVGGSTDATTGAERYNPPSAGRL